MHSLFLYREFNDWEEEANPMEKVGPIGVYEVFIPGAKIGQLYKFFIVGAHGEKLYKADPYANEAELRPGTASRITGISQIINGRMPHGSRIERSLMSR